MDKGISFREIKENIEMFLAIVEESRKKRQIRDNVLNLKMVYTLDTDDCEIFIDQVDGRLSSIKRVKNGNSGSKMNGVKPKLKKGQAKAIQKNTDYFMGRIHKAANSQRKMEGIILEHNLKIGVTDIFIAYFA